MLNDEQLNKIGETLARHLYLKKDKEHKDRYQTEWGTKTGLGLVKMIQCFVKELEEGKTTLFD